MQAPWLLLFHQIPPEPLYQRAKILRKIKQLGGIAVKKAAYVLPNRPDCLEDLQWLRKEIIAGAGEAWILECRFVAGCTSEEMEKQFREERKADYEALTAECRESEGTAKLERLRKRLADLESIDFFDAPGKDEVRQMLNELTKAQENPNTTKRTDYGGLTWVTRPNVGVDRMASAWLIRRFLDRAARFRFDEEATGAKQNEIRFDMFEGEFTHEDDLCTFEVLLRRHNVDDPGLQFIAQIIHDLDLKETKYERAETAGIAAALAGIQKRWPSDGERLHHSAAYFDILYTQFAPTQPESE